ncbi:hypothetical protein PCA31118_03789 [Pandoraea captiosa]|uniref:Uncharacterized protein n=2 Tax=Pandoraea captiosa TaxID=2508302 RepID=A0A5E5AFC2_9BURK|nr:hypothetical protein PCA31118_03789 [Pandoraea captiosa]
MEMSDTPPPAATLVRPGRLAATTDHREVTPPSHDLLAEQRAMTLRAPTGPREPTEWTELGKPDSPVGSVDGVRSGMPDLATAIRALVAPCAVIAPRSGSLPPIAHMAPHPTQIGRVALHVRTGRTDQMDQALAPPAYEPILASRGAFDPARHEGVAHLFQALLGPDAVYRSGTGWNIASPTAVVEMQTTIGTANLMVVAYASPKRMAIYFAQDIDAHHAVAPRLHIHECMGDRHRVDIGAVRVVDARRRIRCAVGKKRADSAFARNPDVPCTVPDAPTSAEVAIAEAIALDANAMPVRSRMSVSRLLDVESTSIGMLRHLRKLTRRPIDYVFLRDPAVRLANSNVPTIREYQTLGALANRLRDLRIAGDAQRMSMLARRLLDTDIVTSVARGLDYCATDSSETARLSVKCAVLYLQLLGRLIDDRILTARAVWDMLKTAAGAYLTSMLGFRARTLPDFDAAMVGLFDAMAEARIQRKSIASIVVQPPDSEYDGLLKELSSSWGNLPQRAKDLVQELEGKRFATRTSLMLCPKRIKEIHDRAFATLDKASKILGPRRLTQNAPVAEILDKFRATITPAAIARMSRTHMEATVRANSPALSTEEQRTFEAQVNDALDDAWRNVLPSEAAPSAHTRTTLSDACAAYGGDVSRARKPTLDHVRETALDRYEAFVARYPDASETRVRQAFRASIDATRLQHKTFVEANRVAPGTSTQALLLHGSERVARAAQAEKASRLATLATVACSAKATREHAKRAAEAHASHQRRVGQWQAQASAASHERAQSRTAALMWMAARSAQQTQAVAHAPEETISGEQAHATSDALRRVKLTRRARSAPSLASSTLSLTASELSFGSFLQSLPEFPAVPCESPGSRRDASASSPHALHTLHAQHAQCSVTSLSSPIDAQPETHVSPGACTG